MSDQGSSGEGSGRRYPRNLQGLLNFCTEHTKSEDAPSGSTQSFTEMDPESAATAETHHQHEPPAAVGAETAEVMSDYENQSQGGDEAATSETMEDIDQDLPESERARMQQDRALKSLGLYRFRIPGDGNCLYRALATQLGLDAEKYHPVLREAATKWMTDHVEELLAAGLLDCREDVQEWARIGAWPGQAAIVAFANIFGIDVVVLHGGDQGDIDIQHIMPIDETGGNGDGNGVQGSVILAYLYNGHYDAVVDEPDLPNPQYDAWVAQCQQEMDASEALARQLSRQDSYLPTVSTSLPPLASPEDTFLLSPSGPHEIAPPVIPNQPPTTATEQSVPRVFLPEKRLTTVTPVKDKTQFSAAADSAETSRKVVVETGVDAAPIVPIASFKPVQMAPRVVPEKKVAPSSAEVAASIRDIPISLPSPQVSSLSTPKHISVSSSSSSSAITKPGPRIRVIPIHFTGKPRSAISSESAQSSKSPSSSYGMAPVFIRGIHEISTGPSKDATSTYFSRQSSIGSTSIGEQPTTPLSAESERAPIRLGQGRSTTPIRVIHETTTLQPTSHHNVKESPHRNIPIQMVSGSNDEWSSRPRVREIPIMRSFSEDSDSGLGSRQSAESAASSSVPLGETSYTSRISTDGSEILSEDVKPARSDYSYDATKDSAFKSRPYEQLCDATYCTTLGDRPRTSNVGSVPETSAYTSGITTSYGYAPSYTSRTYSTSPRASNLASSTSTSLAAGSYTGTSPHLRYSSSSPGTISYAGDIGSRKYGSRTYSTAGDKPYGTSSYISSSSIGSRPYSSTSTGGERNYGSSSYTSSSSIGNRPKGASSYTATSIVGDRPYGACTVGDRVYGSSSYGSDSAARPYISPPRTTIYSGNRSYTTTPGINAYSSSTGDRIYSSAPSYTSNVRGRPYRDSTSTSNSSYVSTRPNPSTGVYTSNISNRVYNTPETTASFTRSSESRSRPSQESRDLGDSGGPKVREIPIKVEQGSRPYWSEMQGSSSTSQDQPTRGQHQSEMKGGSNDDEFFGLDRIDLSKPVDIQSILRPLRSRFQWDTDVDDILRKHTADW